MRSPPSPPARRPYWAGPGVFVALLVISVTFTWLSEPYPLSRAHWDAPIHLLAGKHYSEGNYLPGLRERAGAVHDELMHGLYPGEYWSFMRLGHIVLIGTVVQMFGADAATIGLVAGLYRLVFALGLFVVVMGSIVLVRTTAPTMSKAHVQIGAAISLALYLISDIAGYMSGNPVSEVPAILLLGLSVWTLAIASERRSSLYAAMSGCLAFMLYVVRVESIWLYVSFLVAVAMQAWTLRADRSVWSIFIVAGGTSALLYGAYSWVLYPLTDPGLFGVVARTGMKFHGTSKVGIDTQVIAANGLLWLGAITTVPMVVSSKTVRLGALWLALAMIPAIIAANAHYPTQTRMYTTLLPPVFLLSTVGWSYLVGNMASGASRRVFFALLGLCLLGAAISQPTSYSYLRSLPGMWRLQFVREYVATSRYEQVDYHLPELVNIGHVLDRLQRPATLIASPGMQGADHIMIIQFLERFDNRDRQPRETGHGDPHRGESAKLEVHLAGDRADDIRFVKSHADGRKIVLVGTAAEAAWFASFSGIGDLTRVVSTDNFRLVELTNAVSEKTGATPRDFVLTLR